MMFVFSCSGDDVSISIDTHLNLDFNYTHFDIHTNSETDFKIFLKKTYV